MEKSKEINAMGKMYGLTEEQMAEFEKPEFTREEVEKARQDLEKSKEQISNLEKPEFSADGAKELSQGLGKNEMYETKTPKSMEQQIKEAVDQALAERGIPTPQSKDEMTL